MLRRQYKISALVGILLLLWLYIYNQHNTTIVSSLKWHFNTFFGLDVYSELEEFTLPNLQNEFRNNGWIRRPWYMAEGQLRPLLSPKDSSAADLFPDPKRPYEDRIHQQLMYIPPDYSSETPNKLVLLYNYLGSWIPHDEGPKAFEGCPVDRCFLTTNRNRQRKADAVLFDDSFIMPAIPKSPGQVWIIYMLESPFHTEFFQPSDMFNWTITYRPDSDLPTPYGKWVYHGKEHKKSVTIRNFAANKTKLVAWFASNCQAKNLRLEYAMELSKHIQVDIFGDCGDRKCPRSEEDLCFKLLAKNYKFYLAFENSNCKYYITEKFFRNALRHNVIPVVMGGRRVDYEKAAPEGSFIHVDDFSSPQELAKYLDKLDKHDELYNQYFLWRGTGEFVSDKLFWYEDLYAPA